MTYPQELKDGLAREGKHTKCPQMPMVIGMSVFTCVYQNQSKSQFEAKNQVNIGKHINHLIINEL